MASSFYRFARRSLPRTAAASTATAFVAVSLSKNGNKNSDDIGAPDDVVGNVHQSCGGLQSSRLFSNTPYTAPFYSPPFFHSVKSVAICEAPPPAAPSTKNEHQHPAQTANIATYKPTDPAEPVADPTVEITSSDGKKVQMKGGMWGEEQDGLVSG